MTDRKQSAIQQAEMFTITVIVRPGYGPAETVKTEIAESLEWLTGIHNGVRLTFWPTTTNGGWEDDDPEQ